MDMNKRTAPCVQQLLSLLEQCILYSDPEYHPFTDARKTTMGNPKDSSNSTSSTNPSEAQCNVTDWRQIDSSWLTSIDLDFSKPLANGRSFCQLVTPLFPSTNRRAKQPRLTKPHLRKNCYHMWGVQRRNRQLASKASPRQNKPPRQDSTATKLDLLSLPGEIRNMIFSNLFEDARIYISHFPYCQHAFDVHLSIRATCKRINSETAHTLFERLKVYIIRDSRTLEGVLPVDKRIPAVLLAKLQSLTILSSPWNPLTPSYLSFETMPALRHLKIVETHVDVVSSVKYFDGHIQEYWDALNGKAHTMPGNPWIWLKKHVKNQTQLCSVEYEKELWVQSPGSRAAHMGSLSKRHFLTVILTHMEQPIKATKKTELTLDQFEKRCEMYKWMKREDVHISHISHTSTLLRRLEHMRYHSMLDTIEAGTAKLKIGEGSCEKSSDSCLTMASTNAISAMVSV